MKKKIKFAVILSVLVIVLSLVLTGAVLAGNGQSSDGAGPGLENRWSGNADAGTGTCMGNGYGQSSDGAGPGLENCWGGNAAAGTGICTGTGNGQSSECAGPGLQNCWGKNAQ